MSTPKSQLQTLRDAIINKPPFVNGAVTLPADSFTLFYGNKNGMGRINLSNASPHELEQLARACQPATFGLNQNDVLDESYRKAGKLDSADFATKFDLLASGVLEDVRDQLLEGHEDGTKITAELYKLNVYEKDSFFKSHKDTPRSDKMFGSLVIIFPTAHEGGALALRHAGEAWTFDSAKAATATPSSVAYIAFYSDVEHEVEKVASGYRVTLTYNLYFATEDKTGKAVSALVPSSLEEKLKAALASILADDKFLPDGGLLGFGLQHQYPVSMGVTVSGLHAHLKGSDAVISRVCTTLSLDLSLKLAYRVDDDDRKAATDRPVDMSGWCQVEEHMLDVLKRDFGATILRDADSEGKSYNKNLDRFIGYGETVHWVSELTELTRDKLDFIAYGNESSLEHMYGDVFILVKVGKAGERATA